MKITVSEMPDDPAEFEIQWGRLSRHVKKQSSDMVLLPEMPFYYWFCAAPKFDARTWKLAVGAHQKWARRLDELGAPVVLASRPVERRGRRLNEGFVWTKQGGIRGAHFKGYLPNEGGYYEASWYQRGDRKFKAFEVAGWKAGFMVCSDLWSMTDARGYGKQGVELIAVPRATGDRSVEKWVAGGKVAGVLAGAYCVSSNRSGKRGEASFGGHGWVTDPDGELLGLTSHAKPFVTVDIDRARADKAKRTYPRDSLNRD